MTAHEKAQAKAAQPKVKVAKGRGKAQAEDEEEEEEAPLVNKYGVGGINRPIAKPQNKLCSYCPIHIAAHYGHTVSMLPSRVITLGHTVRTML